MAGANSATERRRSHGWVLPAVSSRACASMDGVISADGSARRVVHCETSCQEAKVAIPDEGWPGGGSKLTRMRGTSELTRGAPGSRSIKPKLRASQLYVRPLILGLAGPPS